MKIDTLIYYTAFIMAPLIKHSLGLQLWEQRSSKVQSILTNIAEGCREYRESKLPNTNPAKSGDGGNSITVQIETA